jgi:hypothetical protein
MQSRNMKAITALLILFMTASLMRAGAQAHSCKVDGSLPAPQHPPEAASYHGAGYEFPARI